MTELAKIDLNSRNIIADRVKYLKNLFPEILSEGDGSVDLEKLKAILGDEVVDADERFAFTWPGKHNAIRQSQATTNATLRPCPIESVNWDNTRNLYIEGDNLEVLKLLQRAYFGRIKMIYIDPPYNTGHDFVYKDRFEDSIDNYREQAGLAGQSNAEMSGRFHSDWCSMMYPRLRLARELLSEDGVIFISIDDHELANLINICDELFGGQNRVGIISRATGTTTGQDANKMGSSLDYCVAYSKSEMFSLRGLPLTEADKKRFSEEDERGRYSYLQLRKTGMNDRREDRPNMYYGVEDPEGNLCFPEGPTGYESCWRVERKTYDQLVADNMIIWKDHALSDGRIVPWPYVKYYLEGRTKQVSNLFQDIEGNKKASHVVRDLFGTKGVFDSPKPIEFMKILIHVATDEDDIILDFFSGSGTTAHAAMIKNMEDGTNRAVISVQLPEVVDEKSNARKLGLENICEIGKERIRRAGAEITKSLQDKEKQLTIDGASSVELDVGFRVFKLDESGIEKPKDGQLVINRIKPGRNDLDIIFEMMLKWGLELTYPIEEAEINGYPCYSVAYDELICCMQPGLTVETLEAIAELRPRRVFMMDDVIDDTIKLNAMQIFKRVEEKTQQKIDLRTV